MQPFGQVPAYEEDDLVLFESGAILLHIADRSEVLMPLDSKARARVTAWMFAALNSIEPHIQNLTAIDLFSCRGGLGKKTPASGCQIRTNASGRALRLARQSRLSGGSFHRGGPSDDDRAANSAAY
ncbi:MAG: glutathione S-transferase family protein [Pseudolabrys sp.]